MTTIVKAADAAQFLSLLPRMLGFHPRDSLVLVPFADGRSLGAMRFDLPGDDIDPGAAAATIIGMACRVQAADAVALVVYADAGRAPRRDLVAALEGRAHACGLDVTDALWTTDAGWGRFPDDALQPHPELDDESPAGAVDQSTGTDLPHTTDDERAAVAAALDGFSLALRALSRSVATPGTRDGISASVADGRVDPRAFTAALAVDDLPTLFEEALGWDAAALAPYDAATLSWCLARPALRDIALVQWCRGLSAGDEALDAQLRWEDGEEYPADLAMVMWGEGDQPEPARLGAALGLVRRIAALTPTENRAGALATAGWLSWALGRSTHADAYARAARAIDPGHGLAEIVATFVESAHLPDWAFRRRAT